MIRLKKLFAYSLLLSALALCASAAERRTDLTLLGSLNNVAAGSTLTIYGTLVIDASATFNLPDGSVAWADVSKTSSSLADLATRSASDLNSGTVDSARLTDAAADGSTKGEAAFTAADFDAASGVISIDYANAQAATASLKGFLTADDWTTFNSKVSTGAITGSGLTMATARLLGRSTASSGAVEEISVGSGLSLSAGTLSASGSTGSTFSGALASDDTYEGNAITGLNAGATIAQWEAVYLGGSSTWLLADADGSGTIPARGLAVAAYSSTDPATILVVGTVRNDTWAWTPGGTIYLSTTAGGLTQTAPSTSDDNVQQVGYALTADVAFFNFASGEYLTVE